MKTPKKIYGGALAVGLVAGLVSLWSLQSRAEPSLEDVSFPYELDIQKDGAGYTGTVDLLVVSPVVVCFDDQPVYAGKTRVDLDLGAEDFQHSALRARVLLRQADAGDCSQVPEASEEGYEAYVTSFVPMHPDYQGGTLADYESYAASDAGQRLYPVTGAYWSAAGTQVHVDGDLKAANLTLGGTASGVASLATTQTNGLTRLSIQANGSLRAYDGVTIGTSDSGTFGRLYLEEGRHSYTTLEAASNRSGAILQEDGDPWVTLDSGGLDIDATVSVPGDLTVTTSLNLSGHEANGVLFQLEDTIHEVTDDSDGNNGRTAYIDGVDRHVCWIIGWDGPGPSMAASSIKTCRLTPATSRYRFYASQGTNEEPIVCRARCITW
jgi:hypothetical protein